MILSVSTTLHISFCPFEKDNELIPVNAVTTMLNRHIFMVLHL